MAPKSDAQTGVAHDAGDRGVPALCVRKDSAADLAGADGDYAPPQLDSSGSLRVNVTAGATNTQYTEGDTDTTITGTAALMEGASSTLLPIQGTVADGLLVNLGTNNDVTITSGTISLPSGASTLAEQQTQSTSLSTIAGDTTAIETAVQIMDDWDETDRAKVNIIAGQAGVAAGTGIDGVTVQRVTLATDVALPTGSNAIGKLAANSGVDIGDVDVASIAAGDNNIGNVDVLTIAAGDNNIGNVDIVSGTITTVSTVTGGGIAHDSGDSGNPLKVGTKSFSPDGTTPGTAVAENDRSDAKSDLDGRLFTNDEHPRWWSYHENSSNALTDAAVQADPGDGFQIVITEIFFSTGAATACNIFFEEGSTVILGPWYLEAVAGRGLFWKGKKHITASTAVTVTTSAAIAHGLDIQGYIQAV